MKFSRAPCIFSLLLLLIVSFSCRDDDEQRNTGKGEVELIKLISTLDSLPSGERERSALDLFSKLENLGEDTLPRSLYLQLFDQIDDRSESMLKRTMYEKAMNAARQASDSLALGSFYLDMSQFYWKIGAPDSTYMSANKAYQIFNAQDNPFYAGWSAYNMAVAQFGASDYVQAEETAILSLNLFEVSTDENKERRILSSYNLLGSIASALKAYERAIEYRETALQYIDSENTDITAYYSIMNNLGNTQIEAGAYRDALQSLEEVTGNSQLKEDNPHLYAMAILNRGRANFALGNLEAVEEDYREALEIRNALNETRNLPRSYYFLAQYFWSQQDTSQARDFLTKGKEIALETEELDGLQDILKLQMVVDGENSAQYGLELSELKDSLIQEERSLRDKFARVRYQTDQYIAENQFLSRQRMIWIWIAMGVLLLGVALFIIIDQRIRNQKLRFLQQQQEANQEIFNLMLTQNEKIEEGKQEEQKRISEELHDGVLGEMNGIRMVLLGLNGKEDENSVALRAKAIEKLKNVQEEIRGISHALSDAAYQKFSNFIVSIEDLLQNTAGAAKLDYDLEYDQEADWDSVSGELKINLYRIIQECLQNTIKHARATRVTVELGATCESLEARIRDDGRGLPKRRGKRGIGQKNIISRVQRLGGKWEIESAPGSGTEIWVQFPRRQAAVEKSPEVLEGSV